MRTIFLTILILLAYRSATAQVPAFPGAEGFARTTTTGGRGGNVYHVTNLDDSGNGSLRWALQQPGPRTIVFDVSGVIELKSNLQIKDNTTIAGQTAPGMGITLRYYTVENKGNNVIIRYLRFRRGEEKEKNDGADAFWGRNRYNIIIDHCSMSWSIDECASFYDNKNFTMQWCTVAESLNNAGHNKGAHGYGGIWGGKGASFHHNFLAHHTNRSPRLNGARYGWEGTADDNWASCIAAEKVDLRNCLIYNWGTGNGAYGGMGGNHNIVNNYYKYGPATKNKYLIFQCSVTTGKESLPAGIWGKFYVDGNYVFGKGANYDWAGMKGDKGYSESTCRLDTPVEHAVVTTHSAETAFEKVMAHAGASLSRDDVDARYAEEAKTGTATYKGSESKLPGIIDLVGNVKGYTSLPSESRPDNFDTDKDGIPDEWEIANGLDPDRANNNEYNVDSEKQWYTDLEVYINSLVEDITKAQNADAISAVEEYYPKFNATAGVERPVHDRQIKRFEYFTTDGRQIPQPAKGISLRRTVYTDGKSIVEKIER